MGNLWRPGARALIPLWLLATTALAQEDAMTIPRLLEAAGARSAAAASGSISARVTEYKCLAEGDAAAQAYERAVAAILAALESIPPGAPVDPALVVPDRKEWAVETWYEFDYIYDNGRYRLSRVTPAGTYHEAFDGIARHRAEQGNLYIDRVEERREPLGDLDVSLMRWDRIPPEAYQRDDQECELKRIDDTHYNLWLRNKTTGDSVDQIFDYKTGMLERGTMRNAEGQVLQEHLWLRPILSGAASLPSVYVSMDSGNGQMRLAVRAYKSWQARPVTSDELAIPRDAYETVSGSAFPSWRRAVPNNGGQRSGLNTRQKRGKATQSAHPGIDELELAKTPPSNYVMRTLGLVLIVVALGLIALWAVRFRKEATPKTK